MLATFFISICVVSLSFSESTTNPDSLIQDIKQGPETDKPYMAKEFSISCPGMLKIFTLAGNVEVMTSSTKQKVKVELYVDRGFAFWSHSKNLDNFRITMLQRGNEIIASVERKHRDTGFFSDQISFSFRAYIPESMSTELKTLGGNISLENVHGRQSIKTGGGNIIMNDISGRLEAFTSGGNITINNSRGTLYAQTEGGNISLDQSSGEIRLKTNGGKIVSERTSGTMLAQVGGGDIWADFLQVGEGINLETSAGNIHLGVPEFIGYQLSLKGSKVRFNAADMVQGEVSSEAIHGMYKDGGAPINLMTNAGTVTLNIK